MTEPTDDEADAEDEEELSLRGQHAFKGRTRYEPPEE